MPRVWTQQSRGISEISKRASLGRLSLMDKDKQILLTQFGDYFKQLVHDIEEIKEKFKDMEREEDDRLRGWKSGDED
jgi:hypothetical protein